MPELAEVAYFRKQWEPGLKQAITDVQVHPRAAVFRDCDVKALATGLAGARLVSSAAAGKQMLFQTDRDGWLGIHLGMTGSLRVEPLTGPSKPSDHFVLVQADRRLVFSDPRMFGRVLFTEGKTAPDWWTRIAPSLLSKAFSPAALAAFLNRRARTPIKSVLLMQERFPGLGNWMADEILWRARLHPKRLAGSISPTEIAVLHQETRWVCRQALKIIGQDLADPPSSWLFPHRWKDGGACPQTGVPLKREMIGGRTTCWSPARQPGTLGR